MRYGGLLKRLGAKVVVECLRPLARLLAFCPAIDTVVTSGDPLPPFDFHIPLISIPAVFKTNLSSIPNEVPYLFADAPLVARWGETLKRFPGFRIGINWRGKSETSEWRKRDIPLDLIASLADISDVQLISLQKGAGQEDLSAKASRLPIVDLGEFDTKHGGRTSIGAALSRAIEPCIW